MGLAAGGLPKGRLGLGEAGNGMAWAVELGG
jgi:hypothetical protein